jgi:CheY-like chemotaxis protein
MVSGDQPTVLLVEDDAVIRELAAGLLREQHLTVLEASSAPEAIAALKQHAHAIVLLWTDVVMPGPFDGLMLAQAVHISWPWIRIVVTSGNAPANDIPPGATFVRKPWTWRDIARIAELARKPGRPPDDTGRGEPPTG